MVGFLVKPARGDRGIVMAELAVPPPPIDSAERRELQAMVNFWDGQVLTEDRAPTQHEPPPLVARIAGQDARGGIPGEEAVDVAAHHLAGGVAVGAQLEEEGDVPNVVQAEGDEQQQTGVE